ncbi:MAG: tRNA lysidine(34) synthetase TilS [Bacteroidota bacterium]
MNNTLHKISSYIEEKKLFLKKDKLLVAVSGGIDSIVLLHILHHLHYSIQVAHVNFQLRGEESNADESFVKQVCEKLQIPFHTKRVDVKTFALENKGSTQMLARQLRYDWFQELVQEHQLNYIVVAHHANDQSETILQHISKGAGIAGLRGMLPKQNKIVRPFLCIDKNNIQYLAEQLKLKYREDSSNASDKYERNQIRHQVVPVLETINPNLHQSIFHTTHYLNGVEMIYQSYIQKRLNKLVIRIGEQSYKAAAKSFAHDGFGLNLLFEWLHPYGFNSEQLNDIYTHVKLGSSGKKFSNIFYQVFVDRKFLFLEAIEAKVVVYKMVNEIPYQSTINQKNIEIKYTDKSSVSFDKKNLAIFLDAEDIQFPITIRHWQEGDYMYPLGMLMKKKKVSDLLINKKIAKQQKSNLLLFFSNEKLLYVESIGIDERFKIKDSTEKIIKISIN